MREGRIYTIHLEQPLGDDGNGGRSRAGHYTGWVLANVHRRIMQHRARRVGDGRENQGGQLLAHANTRGIPWRVVEIRPGSTDDERRLKQRSARDRCPVCNPKKETRPMYPGTHRYASAGNVGITARQVYTFHCGICAASAEYVGANVAEGKRKAHGDGWRNGYRKDLASTYRDASIVSSWRCPECQPTSGINVTKVI